MSDLRIRKTGRAGRVTLTRPKALNAVTWEIVEALTDALPRLAADDEVALLVIDAEGDRAFSAGGDIAAIYADLTAGDHEAVRAFWRAEYPLNKTIFEFPKPVATFLQGYTMGGGVGIGCHASHRVVGDTSRIAMPECGIGLVPDVGGSLLLARAPGRMGEYLAATSRRMDAGDAIHAGFADYYLPEDAWPGLIARLEQTGDWTEIDRAARPAPDSALAADRARIDAHFAGATLGDILRSLRHDGGDWARATLAAMEKNAPLSVAAAVELVRRARGADDIAYALRQEYRFVHRIVAQGQFTEGIRATIIDKDHAPRWPHDGLDRVTPAEVAAILSPLGPEELNLEDAT